MQTKGLLWSDTLQSCSEQNGLATIARHVQIVQSAFGVCLQLAKSALPAPHVAQFGLRQRPQTRERASALLTSLQRFKGCMLQLWSFAAYVQTKCICSLSSSSLQLGGGASSSHEADDRQHWPPVNKNIEWHVTAQCQEITTATWSQRGLCSAKHLHAKTSMSALKLNSAHMISFSLEAV